MTVTPAKLFICWFFFKIILFEKLFQEYHQSVKQFGTRTSGLIWIPTVCKSYQQTTLCGKEVICENNPWLVILSFFLWLSLGRNQYRREGLWFVCLLYDGSTRRLTESGFMWFYGVFFMEKPGIEPATPGLQGIALIHYTTGLVILSWGHLIWYKLYAHKQVFVMHTFMTSWSFLFLLYL